MKFFFKLIQYLFKGNESGFLSRDGDTKDLASYFSFLIYFLEVLNLQFFLPRR